MKNESGKVKAVNKKIAALAFVLLFSIQFIGMASASPAATPDLTFTTVYQVNDVFTGVNWSQNSLMVITPQYTFSGGNSPPLFNVYNMTYYSNAPPSTFTNRVYNIGNGQTVFQNDNYYSGVGNTTFVDVFMIANGTNYPFSSGVWVPTSTVNYTSYLNLSFLPSFYQQNQFHTPKGIYINNVSLLNNTGTFFYGFSPFKNGEIYGTVSFNSTTVFNLTINGNTYTNTRTITLFLPVGSYQYNATANGITLQGIAQVSAGGYFHQSFIFFKQNFASEYVLLAFLVVVAVLAMAFAFYLNKNINVFFTVVFAGLYFGYFVQVPFINSTVIITVSFFVIAFALYLAILRDGKGGTKTELLPITEYLASLDFFFVFIVNLMGIKGVSVSPPNLSYYLNWNLALSYSQSIMGNWGLFNGLRNIVVYIPAGFVFLGNVFDLVLQYIYYLYSLATAPIAALSYPVSTIFQSITTIILALAAIMSFRLLSSGFGGSK